MAMIEAIANPTKIKMGEKINTLKLEGIVNKNIEIEAFYNIETKKITSHYPKIKSDT